MHIIDGDARVEKEKREDSDNSYRLCSYPAIRGLRHVSEGRSTYMFMLTSIFVIEQQTIMLHNL